MRRRSLWLVALAVLATAAPAVAQRSPITLGVKTEALQRIATAAEKDYRLNRSNAIELAKKNGWVIEQTYPDGSYASLQGLDSKGLPIYYITYNNSRAAATTKTDQLWAGGLLGLNLSGASDAVANKLGMWDGGRIRASHQELAKRVVQKDNPSTDNDHATHVAGTLVASGVNAFSKGMAFGVKNLQAYDFNGDYAEMAAAAPNLLISNHSYGSITGWRYNSTRKGTSEDPYWEWWGDTEISETEDYKFGYYDETTAKWDQLAYNAPHYLIVKSAGNNRNETGPAASAPYFQRSKSGTFTLVASRSANISNNNSYDVISTYGTAKNILTVGAVSSIAGGYTKAADVVISSFSSYGPTDDGRIKPDIVGNGIAVLSSSSDGDRSYKSLSGTSMAAPNVSGTLLLLQEHYSNLNNGATMRAATLKGLAIHTADEAGANPGPDYIYGWGLLNASKAATAISNTNNTHLIQEKLLAQGQTQTLEVIASGAGPLVVTISWTDPEGPVTAVGATALNNRTPRLVNDLDVRVADNTTTFLPWTLDPTVPAQAAQRGDNRLDNVEQILIPDAIPGKAYTITVRHKGTLSKGPQAYSLLVSGVGGTAYCTNAAATNTGAKISSLSLAGTNVQLGSTCTTYKDLTNNRFEIEPGQTKAFTIGLGSCGTDAPKIAKVFVDWNGDGDFNDAGEEVAVSEVVNGTATFLASVTAPATIAVGNNSRMRVVLQETTDPATVTACGTTTRGETQDLIISFVQARNDIGLLSVKPAGTSLCASPAQAVVARIRNYGAATQTNIPVTVRVLKDGTEVAQLTGVYRGQLEAFKEDELTLDGSFATEAGASYELVANTSLVADVVSENNRSTRAFTVNSNLAAPQATAFRCGNNPNFTLISNQPVLWYNSLTATVPIAAGTQLQLPIAKAATGLYAAFNDFSGTIGPATKKFATGGGYNQFSPDVIVSTNAPMILEAARLYIGSSGSITFTVFDFNGAPVSEKTIQVTATRTTPGKPAEALPDDPNDVGAVYQLGLELPAAGDYKIAISYQQGATIYRNNEGVAGYPFGIPGVVSVNGNTATSTPLAYYYYFYDLKVSSLGCRSERVEIEAKGGFPLDKPVISRELANLRSSAQIGNQWFFNGTLLPGATEPVLSPTESGEYKVMIMKDGCLSEMSESYSYSYKEGIRELGKELVVSPNPSTGRFRVELETSERQDITMHVTNTLGNTVYTGKVEKYYGQYEGFIDLSAWPSGLYVLRVKHGDQSYTRKLLLQK